MLQTIQTTECWFHVDTNADKDYLFVDFSGAHGQLAQLKNIRFNPKTGVSQAKLKQLEALLEETMESVSWFE